MRPLSKQIPVSSVAGKALGAAFFAGGLVGLGVGGYIALANPIVGLFNRLALICLFGGAYAIVLTIPIALALTGLYLVPGVRHRFAQRFGVLVSMGVGIAGTAVSARYGLDAVEKLGTQPPKLVWFGLAISALVFVASLLLAKSLATVLRLGVRRIGGAKTLLASVALVGLFTFTLAVLPGRTRYLRPDRSQSTTEPSLVQDFRLQPPSRKVALIGFDGLDPEVLDSLLKAGELPNFASLKETGFSTRLETHPLGLSPPIWTTLATGVDPTSHGIHHFVSQKTRLGTLDLAAAQNLPQNFGTVRLLTGLLATPLVQESLIRPSDRRAPALWTLSSLGGVDTCVVDWMGTWPSEPVTGAMVSDRAFFWWNAGRLWVRPQADSETLPLRLVGSEKDLENSGATDGLCFPEPDCRGLFPEGSPVGEIDPAESWGFHVEENSFYLKTAERLLAENRCDFFVFYSHLPDFYNHLLPASALRNVLRGETQGEAERGFVELYREVDRTLGALLAALGPDRSTLLVSDHGVRVSRKEGKEVADHGYPAPPGVFLFRSSNRSARQVTSTSVNILDIAPTVLALLGLPVSSAMQGGVLDVVERSEFGTSAAIRVIDSAALPAMLPHQTNGEVLGMEEDVRERLRALGYID